ncbi:hypothetical protein WJX74_009503 [Apatococcus lobatus]|uniref:Senescence domain-containing protein n=2 Tax=Apatococcus TaxID=904362 RepID=A0AAW1TEW5_9CHLO
MGVAAPGHHQQQTHQPILSIPNARLSKIDNGVTLPVSAGQLLVHMLDHSEGPVVMLRVGEIEFQLDTTLPVLRADRTTYVFAMPGDRLFYHLSIPPGANEEEDAMLEAIFVECTCYKPAGALTPEDRDTVTNDVTEELMKDDPRVLQQELVSSTSGDKKTYAEHIVSGGNWASGFIGKQAAKASVALEKAGLNLQDRITPNEQPTNMSPATLHRVAMVRKAASGTALRASSVLSTVNDIASRVADGIVRRLSHDRNYNQQLQSQEPEVRRGAIKEICAASVLAADQIFDAMQQAAGQVAMTSGTTASGLVNHKYGPQAGQVATDLSASAYHAGQTGMSVMSLRKLGVRTVARRVAKRTAKGLTKSYVLGKPPPGAQQQQQAQAMPGGQIPYQQGMQPMQQQLPQQQQQGMPYGAPQQQAPVPMRQPSGKWVTSQGPRPAPRPILGGVAHPHAAKQYPL